MRIILEIVYKIVYVNVAKLLIENQNMSMEMNVSQ